MGAKVSSSQREVEHRRQLFIAAYAATGNATSAAIAAGYAEKNADVTGDRLLREPATGLRAREARQQHVQATVSDFERQQRALCTAADDAIATLVEIAAAAPRAGAMARVQAAVAILDRAGHKPVERIESAVAWADVTRELGGIDVRVVLQDALDAISHRPPLLPGPDAGDCDG